MSNSSAYQVELIHQVKECEGVTAPTTPLGSDKRDEIKMNIERLPYPLKTPKEELAEAVAEEKERTYSVVYHSVKPHQSQYRLSGDVVGTAAFMGSQ